MDLTPFQKKKLDIFADSTNEYINSRHKWFRNVLVMASGLLGLLISLHTTSSPTCLIRIMFASELILLSLGILAGIIYLLEEVHNAKAVADKWEEEVLHNLDSESPVIFRLNRHKGYAVARVSSVIFLTLALINLVCYAIILDGFPS
jgi:hypothetical protein